MLKIKNRSLIRNCSFINGQWLTSTQQFEVLNPANKECVASIYEVESSQLELAITSASNALETWQALTAQERAFRLNQWQLLLRANLDDLARLLVLEQGKPLQEAKGEIIHAANYVELYAEISSNFNSENDITAQGEQRAKVIRRPIGVVTAITPWNFPCVMVLRKAAAAIAAGCSVVLKPSELTPLTALASAYLSVEAGIPEGVFNVVTGSNAQAIGEILTQHEKVAKFSFTGSTKIGKKLLQQCAVGVKKTAMELGGNAPFIVFKDADLAAAVDGAMLNKFRNAGQTCVAANRFLIHQDIAEEFTRLIIDKIGLLKLGDGLNSDVQIGPLISESAIEKTQDLIERAVEDGAELMVGGKRLAGKGNFYLPTVIRQVKSNMAIFKQEIFAPVMSIITFENDEQAIQIANQTEFGLCAYLYSNDQDKINNLSKRLQVGMLGINESKLSNPLAPFGGIKQSGMGREGGYYGIEEYLYYQYVCEKIVE